MIFEIVPNLSDGRDAATIAAAAEAVERTGARVLHRTSDAEHHRSVLTVAGTGDQCVAAAVALAAVAVERIDLRAHAGLHPRIGALDVLPFVPLGNATVEEAARLAHRAGSEIWKRYAIPAFYYGAAARKPQRRLLPDVRRGEFEGLDERFADPAWRPDEGDVAKHPSAGAVAIGARGVLVAFNIELATADLATARAIARAVRERSGGLRTLRALAFPLDGGRTQVSLNVTDYRATPLHRVVELVRRLARERGIEVVRGELIGLVPRAAVEAAAAYYLGLTNT